MKISDSKIIQKDTFIDPYKEEHNSLIEFLNTIHWEEDDEVLIKTSEGELQPSSICVKISPFGKKTFYICR